MHTHPTDPATRAAAEHAAALLEQADALIVAAGAGMGWIPACPTFGATKGSGVPTLRWRRRGWTLPPSLRPQRFVRRPNWPGALRPPAGAVPPHGAPRGLWQLQRWGARMHQGLSVFTSNVDGQFQMAGYLPTRCMNATAPSTICSAWKAAATPSGLQTICA